MADDLASGRRAPTHVFARGVDEGGFPLLEEVHDAGEEDFEELGGVDILERGGVDRVAEVCCDCEPEFEFCGSARQLSAPRVRSQPNRT